MARFDWKKIQRWVIGAPRDPMHREQREGMLLVAFLAWIGLGADGLSSANYGPEEAFLALGIHSHLAIYLALATALTVVIICLGYVQVIELFPSGGGGYRVASVLVGPYAGLVSGSALIVNFILTAALSVASGVDALFSLLPLDWQTWKVPGEIIVIILLDHRQSARGQGASLPADADFRRLPRHPWRAHRRRRDGPCRPAAGPHPRDAA